MKEHIGGAAKNAGESFDGMVGNVKAAIGRLGEQFESPTAQRRRQEVQAADFIPIIDQDHHRNRKTRRPVRRPPRHRRIHRRAED